MPTTLPLIIDSDDTDIDDTIDVDNDCGGSIGSVSAPPHTAASSRTAAPGSSSNSSIFRIAYSNSFILDESQPQDQ